jgi:hypothetical protein
MAGSFEHNNSASSATNGELNMFSLAKELLASQGLCCINLVIKWQALLSITTVLQVL